MDIVFTCVTPLEHSNKLGIAGQRMNLIHLDTAEPGRQKPSSKEAGQIVAGVQTSVTDAAHLQWIIPSGQQLTRAQHCPETSKIKVDGVSQSAQTVTADLILFCIERSEGSVGPAV